MVNSGTGRAPQDIWDVVIIGLGPTGLTLAHLLGRRGLKVLALEREPQFYGNALSDPLLCLLSLPTTNACGSSRPPASRTNSTPT